MDKLTRNVGEKLERKQKGIEWIELAFKNN